MHVIMQNIRDSEGSGNILRSLKGFLQDPFKADLVSTSISTNTSISYFIINYNDSC